MSYQHITEMYNSTSLRSRITAAIAQEVPGIDPMAAASQYMWLLIARTDWIDAWSAADTGADYNPDIGARAGVITDQMILSAIQSVAGP